MEWIRIEDRLPVPNVPVICYDSQFVTIASMPDEKEFNEHWNLFSKEEIDERGCTSAVTHWMPMPDPPTEIPKFGDKGKLYAEGYDHWIDVEVTQAPSGIDSNLYWKYKHPRDGMDMWRIIWPCDVWKKND